jgi:hypothetical protein
METKPRRRCIMSSCHFTGASLYSHERVCLSSVFHESESKENCFAPIYSQREVFPFSLPSSLVSLFNGYAHSPSQQAFYLPTTLTRRWRLTLDFFLLSSRNYKDESSSQESTRRKKEFISEWHPTNGESITFIYETMCPLVIRYDLVWKRTKNCKLRKNFLVI